MGFQIVKLTDPIQFTNVAGGLVPRGAYNGATDYSVGDSVDYNGSSYVMFNDAGAGTLPTNTTYWQVLANKGDQGDAGTNGQGVPTGGTTGQVLAKIDGTDFNTDWVDQSGGGAVDSVNDQTGVVVLDADDIDDTSTTNKFVDAALISKVAGIEAGADVTDAANVNAAGAVMNSDYTLAHSILVQQSGTGSPTALQVSNNTIVGRASGGGSDIDDLSASQVRTIINVEDGAEVNNISDANATDLTDAGDTALHFHSSDRNRANHTGTQTASTISDFDTEVSNNTDVAANTAARHAAATVTDSTSIDLTITGQDITAQREALIGDVTAPKNSNTTTIANDAVTNAKAANMAANTIKGRITGSTGDPEDLTAAQVRTITETETTTQLNTRDTNNRARANHTGTQASSTISDFDSASRAQTEAALVAGTNITITPSGSGATRQLTIASSGGGGVSDGDKGDITVSGSGTVWTIDNDTIGLDELSATGTPSSSNFLRGDNTWATPSGGGSVTSVAVSGSDGIEIDSGSPITGAGTIALGVNAAALRTHINVANGATAYTDENAQDAVGTILTDTTSIDLVYDDAGNTISAQREALTGDVTASKNSNATTIANDVVTNAKAANMAVNTIKGRITAGTGDPEDLTAANVRTIINVADGATANSADATLLARANHTGTQTASTISDFNTAADARITAATGVSVQGYDADLQAIGALTPTNDDILQRKAGAWTNRTIAQYKTDLALVKADVGLASVDNTSDATKNAASATLTNKTIALGSNTVSGTKAQFDTAVTDGNFLYVGDITQYTDEAAQDAVGAMVDTTLVYTDGTPLLSRAALTGAITASAGSNTTALGSFTTAQLNTALSDNNIATGGGTATGTNTGDQNLFSTVAVSGQSNVVADSTSDTLTLVAGSNVTITTNATTDEVTISATGGGGGGSGEATEVSITQSSHGFSVGNVLKKTGASYALAQANSAANAEVVGIVSVVTDANTFTLLTGGYIDTLSGLTANETYFLSPSSAGAMTTTEPTTNSQISKPLLNSVSTTAGVFNNMRGIVVEAAGTTLPIGGSTTEIQFNNAGAFGGDADLTWDSSNNVLGLNGTDTGILMQGITTEPAAPSTGKLELYAKSIGGRMSLKTIGPSGVDTPLQNALWGNNISMWSLTTATAGVWLGTAGAGAGTYTTALPTTTSLYTSMKRARWANVVTTTNQVLGQRNTEAMFFRGNAAGQGGFFFFARLGFDVWTNGGRFFAGMHTGTTVISADPSALNNTVGFCVDAADNGAISFLTRGTSATKASTGYTITSGKGYDVYIFCAPNSSQYTWRIVDINAGTEATGTATANLPTNTTMQTAGVLASNAALTPVTSIQLGLNRIYVETDR